MVAYLKAHPSVRVMLVEKTDRLYRNLKDWVTVDELDVEMHFPKEGVVLSRESRSSEKFMHGIKVLMAKNYIDNLSEEARKGMRKRPSRVSGPPRRRSAIATSRARTARRSSPTSRQLAPISEDVRWYARGDISLKEAAHKAHAAGLTYPKSGGKHAEEHGSRHPAQPPLYRAGSNGTARLFRAARGDRVRPSYGNGCRT